MAPKLGKFAKAAKTKSVKKGLAGTKAPSGPGCALDVGVAKQNASLAKKVRVMPGIHARLALIDAAKNNDKYYVLQGLEDPKSSGNRFYAYSRWGRTGTAGSCKLDGPMTEEKAKSEVAKTFKQKTGCAWGTLRPGDKAKPGKYWVMQAAKLDPKAKWEYYVSDHVDGKKTGWYPYDKAASLQVEELRAAHAANKGGKNDTSVRCVDSGSWTYKVDLGKMQQTNTSTKKTRKIRRQGAK
mmetsp:Transcript_7902/g.12906  ORF Transcript_7902/g.12906 Transcript_7902/m.12906 type:complete len:239 (-) Transcript_7902:237-953(-)|eukprot:CAMPEP_0169276220 /NCGR_PEP_ID=MMETSP1016-20121227/52884_1 /TAXON_ID=342587 /ORGANISM="Karlodinium micrum, Strain CCMP2283" /LENGTH=238 /DNA_ID=CAMNT_0009363317 /DNA_START=38 /DNA_END=754 /DNA_ORIENTATION=+